MQEASFHCAQSHLENTVVLSRPYTELRNNTYEDPLSLKLIVDIMTQTDHKVRVQKILIFLAWNIFKQHASDWQVKFLGLVYVVFIPSHSLDTLVTPTIH